MAWRNWRRVLELGWAMGPAFRPVPGLRAGRALGDPDGDRDEGARRRIVGPPSQ